MNMETQTEKTFLEDSNVHITNSRFVAAGKTFAMNNISSVSAHHYPKSKFPAILLMIVSIVMVISGNTTALILGILLLGAAILWFRSIKDVYSVRINSNSGEADGLTSNDKEYIFRVVGAVNEAIIHRG
jgi:hypothetical protein